MSEHPSLHGIFPIKERIIVMIFQGEADSPNQAGQQQSTDDTHQGLQPCYIKAEISWT